MANQVKEILPHVPMTVILNDLSTFTLLSVGSLFLDVTTNFSFCIGRTNSVDATVANLVEGVVPFTPEPVITRVDSASAGPSPGPSNYKPTGTSSQVQQVSSPTFAKSVHERGLSLQERKQRLLREAQLRYCEKHSLQVPGMNC